MKKHALFIGINRYRESSDIPSLNYSEDDAKDFAGILEEHCDFQCELLLGKNATRDNIRASLKKCEGGDIFLFFFAGHGEAVEGHYYLHPFDGMKESGLDSLSFTELSRYWNSARFQYGKCVAILDACRSSLTKTGQRGTHTLSGEDTRDIVAAQEQSERDLRILYGCGNGQSSYEFPELKHGLLTFHLLESFRRTVSKRPLTLMDIVEEASDTMKCWQKEHKGQVLQLPQWLGTPTRDRILLIEGSEIGWEKKDVLQPGVILIDEKQGVPSRADEIQLRSRLKRFVSERNGEWKRDDFLNLLASLHDEGVSTGWRRDEIEKLLNEEKVKWVKEEARRKEEEARLAKQARKRAEEAAQRAKEAEEARALAKEEELWYRCQTAGTEEALLEYLQLSKLKKYETEAKKLLPVPPVPQVFTNTIGMKFVLIKAGTFQMGSPSSERGRGNDETQHKVTLTKDFYLQTTEATKAQYEEIIGTNPSYFKGSNLPVESLTWNDAVEFCKRLSQKEGKEYRLPTEAEWEYACRAGSTTRYCYGDDEGRLGEYAWYCGNSGNRTHPVGEKKPNTWGLYDMMGNVWEWCSDWYGEYPKGDVTDPKGPSNGDTKILRGGSWGSLPENVRSANRYRYNPDNGFINIGIRCARTP